MEIKEVRKRRILYMVGWFYPDSVGGSERYVYILAKEMQSRGWDVTVAAPARLEREDAYVYDGIPVYRYPVASEPESNEIRMEAEPKYFGTFKQWVKSNKPDIVHIHSRTRGCGSFHMRYVKKELNIPLVLTVHSADFMCVGGTAMLWGVYPCDGRLSPYRCSTCWLKRRGVPWPMALLLARIPLFFSTAAKKLPYRWATVLATERLFIEKQERDKMIFNISDRIVVVARWLENVLLLNKIPEDKIFLSPHGLPPVPAVKRQRGIFDGTGVLRVGFIGRFNYIKGVHILIRVFRRLSRKMNIELILYGRTNSAEDEKYLARIKMISKSDPRIKFLGELKHDSYQQALIDLDILAVPSLWLETGPLVILEAFSAGLAVLGSNIGGIKELVHDGINGMLIDIGSKRAWIKAFRQVYNDPRMLQEWVRHIPSVRNSRDVVDDMEAIYEEVIAKYE